MTKKNRGWLGKILKIAKRVVIILFILSILIPLLYRFVPPPFTPLMLIRLVQQTFGGNPVRLKKDWVSIDEISPNMILAVVASEDQNFLNHSGFDFDAIKNAYKHNQKSRKKRGASTITQQTAKKF